MARSLWDQGKKNNFWCLFITMAWRISFFFTCKEKRGLSFFFFSFPFFFFFIFPLQLKQKFIEFMCEGVFSFCFCRSGICDLNYRSLRAILCSCPRENLQGDR